MIKVKFGKNGFYHPAFGRLGRGGAAGTIYELPDAFGEEETVEIETWDRSARPPRKTGSRTIKRYVHLPATVEVIDDGRMEELVEEARNANEPPPKPIRPKVADQAELAKVTGRGKVAAPQDAVERTTGRRRMVRKAAAAE